MTAPQFPDLEYVKTEITEDRVNHYYTTNNRPDACIKCGCSDLYNAGVKSPAFRWSAEDGLAVFLVIRKTHFSCSDCRTKFAAPISIKMMTRSATRHFWELVNKCELNDREAAKKFAVSAFTINRLRKQEEQKIPKKGKITRDVIRAPKRDISDGTYSYMYDILHKSPEPMGKLALQASRAGYKGATKAIIAIMSDGIAYLENGKLRLSDFVAPDSVQWPANGPAPRTMRGLRHEEAA